MPTPVKNVAVANTVVITLHQGPNTKLSAFTCTYTSPRAKVTGVGPPAPGMWPIVVLDPSGLLCTLGGLVFTATLVSIETKIKIGGVNFFAVLLGATVTDSDGYSGIVAAEHCAGAGLVVN